MIGLCAVYDLTDWPGQIQRLLAARLTPDNVVAVLRLAEEYKRASSTPRKLCSSWCSPQQTCAPVIGRHGAQVLASDAWLRLEQKNMPLAFATLKSALVQR